MKWITLNGKNYNPEKCYYLDTNMFAFILLNKEDEIKVHARKLLDDVENSFFISPIVLREFLSLNKSEKVKHKVYKKTSDIYKAIKIAGITILPYTEKAVAVESEMYFKEGHKCPFDKIIISQAISDKIAIISADHDFPFYEKQGLQLVFNKR